MNDPTAIWRTTYGHPGGWDRAFKPLTLPAMFDASVARFPRAILTDFYGAQMSYADVGAAAAAFAGGAGLTKGDRIGLFLPNIPDYLIAYYGALKAGAIVVNMSPLYSIDELVHQISDSGARVIVTADAPQLMDAARALLDRGAIDRIIVARIAARLPLVKRVLFRAFKRRDMATWPVDARIVVMGDVLKQGGSAALPTLDSNDVALIQYTGGTTGIPKGAMLTHQALTANARQVHAIDPHTDQADRIIGVLPFFHVFANTCVLNRTVLAGGMIAMLPRFDAAQTLQTIARVKATALPGVPTMYQALLDHPAMATTSFASLRVCISGGAPLAAVVKTKFERATGARVVEGYGLTESAGVVACNPYDGLNKTGSIGQPVPGTLVRLVSREDPTKPVPDGEAGELIFEGPQVMKGYWGRPEADAETFVATATGRALRSGDVATIDGDGYIRIVDRLKDMIAVGGFKVFPSQIEAVLYKHPAVKEVIVIGIPDAYHGEMPKAFVTLNTGATIDGDALMAWLNPQLGKHERVKMVAVRDALPKTLVGKLSRKELVAEERAAALAR
jgi:long-chain acyl-CoA synthetase